MTFLRNPANQILLGVLLMLGGDFMFSLNDAMGKWLVVTLSVGQVVFIRSIGAFIVLGPMIARQGPRALFDVDRPWLQVARATLTAIETILFYASVYYLPLADVFSFYMAGPIYVAALSHLLLGEAVGWRRWTAIVVGFCGVLVMLQPTGSFSLASIYAVAGSILFALTIILGRMLRGTSDTTLVTWQTICSLVLGAGMVLAFGGWKSPTSVEWSGMLLLGVVSCVAHLMIVRALKLAPAALLAPLHYTLLLWAVVFGWVFFGDVPGTRILLGSAIVVLAGLFIFHRQKTVSTVPPEDVPKGVN
ncbi:DMT family transporter [Mesorhizobium sp. KR9-304]|uniref:DMT family transporter n=1 Tax=Mesorhizobium sp. KR9-304 TaxID=3156614 RepID=UPI0032B40EB5